MKDGIYTVRDCVDSGGWVEVDPDFKHDVTHVKVHSKNNHVHYKFDMDGIYDPNDSWKWKTSLLDTPLLKQREGLDPFPQIEYEGEL